MLAGYGTLAICELHNRLAISLLAGLTLSIGICLSYLSSQRESIASFQLFQDETRQSLNSMPQGAIYLPARATFMTRYLQAIEGVRPDISVIELPAVQFPGYFRQWQLAFNEIHLKSELTHNQKQLTTDLIQGALLNNKQVIIDPTRSAQDQLHGILFADALGFFTVSTHNPQGGISLGAKEAFTIILNRYLKNLPSIPTIYRNDYRFYVEQRLLEFGALLEEGGDKAAASELISTGCTVGELSCRWLLR